MDAKHILIIAGPNGAGKTTFAREYLPGEADCPLFVNADLIAEGLSPFAPDLVAMAAGGLMLKRIDDKLRQVFRRSAEQAGLFGFGKDTLVLPHGTSDVATSPVAGSRDELDAWCETLNRVLRIVHKVWS